MKNIYINIEIAGTAGVGKTTIARKIGKILKSHGMSVVIYDGEYSLVEATDKELDRNLDAIGANGEVVIRSRQVMREVL